MEINNLINAAVLSGAHKIYQLLLDNKLRLALAESCTGGMLAMAITSIPGSSLVLERAWCVYSYRAKEQCLGVSATLIEKDGAVSKSVVEAMAKGALTNSDAEIAIAITGIAGPGGGTVSKPLGLVYIAIATANKLHVSENVFKGDRQSVRCQAACKAWEMCELLLRGQND